MSRPPLRALAGDHSIPAALPATLALPSPHERPLAAYWRPDPAFLDELAAELRGRRVLEVFAGNGLLAAHLAARGVEVDATSLLTSMDAHERGLYHPVRPMDAVSAATLLGPSCDVLLMCWPTVTSSALRACEAFGAGRPIAYIGEATDYAIGHLGGCADDAFFEAFQERKRFSAYRGNCMEKACMGSISPAPEPARSTRPSARP